MERIDPGRPYLAPQLPENAGNPTEPDEDDSAANPPGPPEGGRPDERPLATGRLDLPTGFPFEGNAHILVLATSAERRDVTVDLLRRDGDAGWEVDAAGTRDTVRAKLALETFAVVVLFADGEDLAPLEVIRVIESTRRWPTPAVVALCRRDGDGKADLPTAEDLGAFRILPDDAPESDLVEAVRDGVRRDAVRSRPRWDTEPGDSPPAPPPAPPPDPPPGPPTEM